VLTCVWLVTGTSFTDDARDGSVRLVKLVPGEREAPAITQGRQSAGRRPAAAPPARRAPAARQRTRPAAVRPVPLPREISQPPAPAPVSPAAEASDPAPLTPPTETVASAPPAPSAAEEPGPAAQVASAPGPVGGDLASGAEEGRAAPLGAPAERGELGRLQEVTADASVAARAQAEPFVGRREVFEFLLDHLEFATHVTRALRVARYRVWRTSEGLVLDDGWGALLNLSLVQAQSGARVIYARGKYRQTLLPDIRGEAVMMIEYEATPTDGGRDLVSAAVTSYVRVENAFMKLLMKLAQAAVTDKAELESRRLVRTFAKVSRAIEENPAQVFAEVRRSPDVPQAELEEFRKLLRVP
jgi:hypothetical protein